MNWDAIGAIGEIIGAVAVLATLVYLARQVTHSVNLARAQQNKGLMDSYGGWNALIVTEPEIARLLAETSDPANELSPTQVVQVRHLAYRIINVYNSIQLSYVNGQLSDADFAFYKHDIKTVCDFYPALFAAMKEIFSLYPGARDFEIYESVRVAIDAETSG